MKMKTVYIYVCQPISACEKLLPYASVFQQLSINVISGKWGRTLFRSDMISNASKLKCLYTDPLIILCSIKHARH